MLNNTLRKKFIFECNTKEEYENTYKKIFEQIKDTPQYKNWKIEVMRSKILKQIVIHDSVDCPVINLLFNIQRYIYEEVT